VKLNRVVLSSLLVVAAVSACRFTPTHVPLRGSATDIAKLAGKWDGDYSSAQSGRSGAIIFEITAGVDTAHGDVLMTPTEGQPLRATDAGTLVHSQHVRSTELLTVRFVTIEDGMIRGVLESYIAPDCQCSVNTVFRGTITGDRIEGTYTTRGPSALVQEGRWAVSRRR
jgi:hypothetical protein